MEWATSDVKLDDLGKDEIKQAIDKSQVLSTKSLYFCLTPRGVKDNLKDLVWKCKVPLKVKIFLWKVFHNKLQMTTSALKKGVGIEAHYAVCVQ
jgi:hypothetical protein